MIGTSLTRLVRRRLAQAALAALYPVRRLAYSRELAARRAAPRAAALRPFGTQPGP